MSEGLADLKRVDASGERVQPYDNVHAILFNGVLGDFHEIFLLVAIYPSVSTLLVDIVHDTHDRGSSQAPSPKQHTW